MSFVFVVKPLKTTYQVVSTPIDYIYKSLCIFRYSNLTIWVLLLGGLTNVKICMTEFRQENGQVRITKGCKQQTACDVQAQSNRTLCYEYPYVRVCHSCCEGDFCNDDMELPPFRNGKSEIRSE